MAKDNNINRKGSELHKFISSNKKAFIILSAVIFLCIVPALYIIQTWNYHRILFQYSSQAEENQQLYERLELERITITQLEQLLWEMNQDAIMNESKWALKISEWQDRYYKASFEDSHIRHALRLQERQPEVMLHYIARAAENEYYRAEVKFIEGRYNYWGGYVYITILEQENEDSEPSLRVWPTYLTHIDGEWFVSDFH